MAECPECGGFVPGFAGLSTFYEDDEEQCLDCGATCRVVIVGEECECGASDCDEQHFGTARLIVDHPTDPEGGAR